MEEKTWDDLAKYAYETTKMMYNLMIEKGIDITSEMNEKMEKLSKLHQLVVTSSVCECTCSDEEMYMNCDKKCERWTFEQDDL
jgi:hypothetical protein